MNQIENLKRYMVDPLTDVVGKTVKEVYYTDIGGENELTTNHAGIDVIAHQVKIEFEPHMHLYFSWHNVKGWETYALCVSGESFVLPEVDSEYSFRVHSEYWNQIKGRPLTGFAVYGYMQYRITRFSEGSNTSGEIIYYNQPHLILLDFAELQVGIANFYLEDNFEPQLAIGDDVWILFDKQQTNHFIEKLHVEKLFPFLQEKSVPSHVCGSSIRATYGSSQ